MVVAEHAHELHGEVADVAYPGVDVRAADGTGRGGFQIAEIRFFAGAAWLPSVRWNWLKTAL
jgi:hypothetical protein